MTTSAAAEPGPHLVAEALAGLRRVDAGLAEARRGLRDARDVEWVGETAVAYGEVLDEIRRAVVRFELAADEARTAVLRHLHAAQAVRDQLQVASGRCTAAPLRPPTGYPEVLRGAAPLLEALAPRTGTPGRPS